MSVTYKGVTLFNDFDNDGGSFVAWEKLTLGALEKYFAQTHNLLIKPSQELEADIRNIAKGETDVETAERAKLVSSDQNGLSHLLSFVGDPLRCQLLRFNRAREAWRYLHEQYQLWKQSGWRYPRVIIKNHRLGHHDTPTVKQHPVDTRPKGPLEAQKTTW
jgi:hypothetical protein